MLKLAMLSKQEVRDVCPSGVAEIFPGVHKEARCCARFEGLGYSAQQVVEWPEVLANP